MKTTVFVALIPGLIGGVMFLFGAAHWAASYGTGTTVGEENWSFLFTGAGGIFFRCVRISVGPRSDP